jgi:hypothetical protein
MIHFEIKKEMSINIITLSNETTLKSQKSVKGLEIYIDKKLTFKEHMLRFRPQHEYVTSSHPHRRSQSNKLA